jgi:hypothetical protein
MSATRTFRPLASPFIEHATGDQLVIESKHEIKARLRRRTKHREGPSRVNDQT